jgi:hypothetical protein
VVREVGELSVSKMLLQIGVKEGLLKNTDGGVAKV